MHGTIYQISPDPIAKDDWRGFDTIDQPNIGYTYELDDTDRQVEIRHLARYALPKGMFTLNPDLTLTYNGGIDEWKRSYLDTLNKRLAEITPDNIMKWCGPTYRLEKACQNPLDCDSLFITEDYGEAEQSAELMRIVCDLSIGDTLYIGAVIGYHN